MKKILISIIIFICTVSIGSVSADTDYNGYIVKVKSPMIALMCDDELTHIADNLYHADNTGDIYENIPAENIEAVFPNYKMELFELDYPHVTSDTNFSQQWYLEKINSTSLREKGLSGKGVKIAIIDSGMNSAHPDFSGANILEGYNCMRNAQDPYDYSDNVGHGTMVTGIIAAQTDNESGIAGIACNAQIIPIKITDTPTLDMANMLAGVEKALETDCDIINMSFGGSLSDKKARDALKECIDQAVEKGVIVVAAVGNSGTSTINYPAGFDNVIGVGSVHENMTSSYFSQKNKSVFITAPGNNIISLSNDGSTITGSGTSLSTPIVTAVVATIKEVYPNYFLQDIKELLMNTSTDSGEEGYDINYGYGILNVANIIEEIGDDIPEFVISKGIKDSQKRIHIHNNTGISQNSKIFFSSHSADDGQMSIYYIEEIENLADGVTNVQYEDYYDNLFVWSKNLKPYTGKYLIK